MRIRPVLVGSSLLAPAVIAAGCCFGGDALAPSIPESSFVGPFEGSYGESALPAPFVLPSNGWAHAELGTGSAPGQYTIELQRTLPDALLGSTDSPRPPGPALAERDCRIEVSRTGPNDASGHGSCTLHWGDEIAELSVTAATLHEDEAGLDVDVTGTLTRSGAASPYHFTLSDSLNPNTHPIAPTSRAMVEPTITLLTPHLASPEATAYVRALLVWFETRGGDAMRNLTSSWTGPDAAELTALGPSGSREHDMQYVYEAHSNSSRVRPDTLDERFLAHGGTFTVTTATSYDPGPSLAVTSHVHRSSTTYTLGGHTHPGLDLDYDFSATVPGAAAPLTAHLSIPSPPIAELGNATNDYDLYHSMFVRAQGLITDAIVGMFFRP